MTAVLQMTLPDLRTLVRDQYAGDISDFLKLALLRALGFSTS
jgi:hypothetical protein